MAYTNATGYPIIDRNIVDIGIRVIKQCGLCVFVCVESIGSRGSVLLDMRLLLLTLAPKEVLPHMWYPVVLLSVRTSWEAFRRDFQQVPHSWNSMTRSDIITWPISHQVFIAGMHLKQRATHPSLSDTYGTVWTIRDGVKRGVWAILVTRI